MNKLVIKVIALSMLGVLIFNEPAYAVKPNIVIIYIDDLGYGDISVNGAIGVKTPAIDRLASRGMNFSDAHCSSATCTPSRFSLLTGSYAFRSNAAVLPGDAPMLLKPEKETLPAMLQRAGYKTAVVGKWHLGLGNGNVDWNKEIKPGPREVGFDYSFLIPATGDRVPCVFVENQKVVGIESNDPIQVSYTSPLTGYPTGKERPDLLKVSADPEHSMTIVNGISRIGYMNGGEKALWNDEDFPFVLTDKAKGFITKNKDNPFFLYLAYHDIHVPRIPNKQFEGTTGMGARGDAIAQMDWCTGQIIEHLEMLGISENTLIIFSSDNGPVLDDGYTDKAVELLGNHKPEGPFRGAKYSIYEAGTRMPTIVYWPGVVKPGVSNALLNQVDLFASLANLVGIEINPAVAPDSENHMDAWLGKTQKGRDWMLEEAFTYAIRKGDWKFIMPRSSGEPGWLKNKNVQSGISKEIQLYNLKTDIGETKNVAADYPELVKEMQEKLEKMISSNLKY
ncbi:MAG: arylsulfatase [Prolixibacteraceae bacterium]|nr:arylsulfatase [Prolixibacteraceae bacterium]